jgi:hypothetical protein
LLGMRVTVGSCRALIATTSPRIWHEAGVVGAGRHICFAKETYMEVIL